MHLKLVKKYVLYLCEVNDECLYEFGVSGNCSGDSSDF